MLPPSATLDECSIIPLSVSYAFLTSVIHYLYIKSTKNTKKTGEKWLNKVFKITSDVIWQQTEQNPIVRQNQHKNGVQD